MKPCTIIAQIVFLLVVTGNYKGGMEEEDLKVGDANFFNIRLPFISSQLKRKYKFPFSLPIILGFRGREDKLRNIWFIVQAGFYSFISSFLVQVRSFGRYISTFSYHVSWIVSMQNGYSFLCGPISNYREDYQTVIRLHKHIRKMEKWGIWF